MRALAGIDRPEALTLAEDGVYVADERSQSILKFDFAGQQVYQFGSRGKGKSQTKKIAGLASAAGQQVFVGDAGKALINVFQTVAGERIEPLPRGAGRASEKWLGGIELDVLRLAADGKGALYAIGSDKKDGDRLLKLQDNKVVGELKLKEVRPVALALDGAGAIWVADKNKKRVLKLDAAGNELLGVGSAGSGAGQFGNPSAVAVARSGLIFVADRGNRSVQVFREDGVFLNKLGGAATRFENPVALGLDPGDKLFVLDAGRGSVSVFSAGGELLHEFGKLKEGGVFGKPLDMAVTADEVLVLDGNRVKVFDHAGKLLRVFGAKTTGVASLGDPVALASGGGSTLFVADHADGRVEAISVLYKPQAPQKFSAQKSVHAIDLQWAPAPAAYVKSYRIYRSAREDGGYVRIATTAGNTHSDTDLTPGSLYFYRVAALSDGGFEGASSDAVSAVPDKYVPPAPAAVQVETNPWQARLSWEASDPKYFAAYRIYQKEGENLVKVGEVSEPAFTRDGLTPETAYTFYVAVLSRDEIGRAHV